MAHRNTVVDLPIFPILTVDLLLEIVGMVIFP
jgi:hypothetical protein